MDELKKLQEEIEELKCILEFYGVTGTTEREARLQKENEELKIKIMHLKDKIGMLKDQLAYFDDVPLCPKQMEE